MFNHKHKSNGPENVLATFTVAARDIFPLNSGSEAYALLLGTATVATMALWQKYVQQN